MAAMLQIIGLGLLVSLGAVLTLPVGGNNAEITKLHVVTKIQMRYAITNVQTSVRNKYNDDREVFFDMYIPKEAFVSNFSMVINDKTYVAKVDIKEVAAQIYNESDSNAGLVQAETQENIEAKHVTFSAKLKPAEKVTFHLRYEELLQRTDKGLYKYQVNVQPKNQMIPDFLFKVHIDESLPLKKISVWREKEKSGGKSQREEITSEALTHDEKSSPHYAYVDILPNNANNNGKDWTFQVQYDVERPNDGNDVQIGAGKFIHYYTPDKLPTMAKHVIFVIDISGSMSGRKLEQTKDALLSMLDEMKEKNIDSFNILVFSDSHQTWEVQGDPNLSYSIPKNGGKIFSAIDFVLGLNSMGGTNINDAILRALEIAKTVKDAEEIGSKTEQLIIFLSDGEPTSGAVTNQTQIKENIRNANKNTAIPIYGLAFGDGADYNLIKDISDENFAFAKRIYESGNSFEQLENFYKEISDPKLKKVTFEYLVNGKRIVQKDLTSTYLEKAFGNTEYSMAGEIQDILEINEDTNEIVEIETFDIVIKAENDVGSYQETFRMLNCNNQTQEPRALPTRVSNSQDINVIDRCIPFIPTPRTTWNQSDTEAFMERLWAYKRINYLLDTPALSDPTKPFCEEGIDETLEENKPASYDEYSENEEEYEDDLEFPEGSDRCEKEAIRLALKYNFVTDVTSMVVEEDDEYITKKNLEEKEVKQKDTTQYSYVSRSSANMPQYNMASNVRKTSYNSHSYNSVPKMASIPTMMATTGRPNLAQRTPIAPPPPSNQQNSITQSMDWDYYDDDSYDTESYMAPPPPSYTQRTPAYTTPATPTTSTTPPPIGFCKLTLFSSTHFRGEEKIFNSDAMTLDDFVDKVASLKIEGDCCWTLFTEENFGGDKQILNGPKDYGSPTQIRDVYKRAKSAKQHRC